ncbi:hypothetical protein ACFYXS_05725 [Streptomyces sp. NPDC002574]|uniref:hypothetical protein n=1 Tax=Streptomyces sp. NPDC002574 TaxID=3364652 RepID=UPI0036746DE2
MAEVGVGAVLGLVPADDVDTEELAELALNLRGRLLELDVADVRWLRDGVVPLGAKPLDAVEAGVLLVSAAPAVWRGVLELVQVWLNGRPVRGVKVDLQGRSIELTAASKEEQRLLVEQFLRATAGTEVAEESTGER